jgi:hypothetical protein
MIRKIAIINKSTVLSNDIAGKIANVCNAQILKDVAPAWGKNPIPVALYTSETGLGTDTARIYLFDNSDQQGALGYHTETMNGYVYGKVFVKTITDYGLPVMYDQNRRNEITVSSVVSHEVIETFCNPYIQLWADGPSISEGSQYAYEACDAVEANVYQLQTVIPPTQGNTHPQIVTASVSDFVLPEYFDTASPAGTKLDRLGILTTPFTISNNGYMIVKNNSGNVSEIFGQNYPEILKELNKK